MKIYSNTFVVMFCIFFIGGGISLPLNFRLPPRFEKNLMTLPTSSPPLTNSTNNSMKMPIVEDESSFWEDFKSGFNNFAKFLYNIEENLLVSLR